jgi:hypothetical protein
VIFTKWEKFVQVDAFQALTVLMKQMLVELSFAMGMQGCGWDMHVGA